MEVDMSSFTAGSVNDDLTLSASSTSQLTDMHHLAAVAVSTSNSECSASNPLPFNESQMEVQMSMPVLSQNRTSVARRIQNFRGGGGATSLILDGPSLNHGNSEIRPDIEYEAQLNSLAKIPASRLGKGNASTVDGDASSSVFPPAFTVVLSGVPPNLAHRLFTSANSRIFSQPVQSLPAAPSAAAVIAAPPNPDCTGTLFLPLIKSTTESEVSYGCPQSAVVQPITSNMHSVTVVANDTALVEVDESSAAVAELASEEATVSVGNNEPFEEDMDESIHISAS